MARARALVVAGGAVAAALLGLWVQRNADVSTSWWRQLTAGVIVDDNTASGGGCPWACRAGDVPRETWTSADRIAARRMPVVLHGSPAVTQWRASETWQNLTYLASVLPGLGSVKINSGSPVFIYEDLSRLWCKEKHLGTSECAGAFSMRHNVSPAQYLTADPRQVASHPHYCYYSHMFDAASGFGAQILSDAEPENAFAVRDQGEDCAQSDGRPSSWRNIWISANRSVTAAAHFDPSHNFFANIVGRKRFLVFPPEAWSVLHAHPFYHPRDRQSQLDADLVQTAAPSKTVACNDEEGDGRLGALVADLEPGDVLYVPPHHWHRVTVLEAPSVAVNTWSTSLEQALSDRLNSLVDLPSILSDAGTGLAKVAALATLLRALARLVDGLGPGEQPTMFFGAVFEQRFLGSCPGEAGFAADKCPRSLGELPVARVRNIEERAAQAFATSLGVLVDKREQRRFPHGQAIARSILADFAERAVTFTVGIERECGFLGCLAAGVHSMAVVAVEG